VADLCGMVLGVTVLRMKTRRDRLVAAASVPLSSTGTESSAAADPIVEAIARRRDAAAAYSEAPSDETHAEAAEAFDGMCRTEPTTLCGLKMFANQLVTEFEGEWAGDIDAFEVALTTLRNALAKVAASQT
jgi:hypothetical protein